jgi:sulfite exporter TauE/SafE
MAILFTAIFLGLMGSFHCAGMCGPIALSLPLQGNSLAQKMKAGLLYNWGRISIYGIMGLLFGLIGQGFVLIGFQQWISIVMGITMISSVVISSLFHSVHITIASSFATNVRSKLQALFTVRTAGGLVMLGAVNALLPCGLVYMAIAGSIGTGNAILGMLFMIIFGLGTIPMLLFISVAGNLISTKIRLAILKRIPILVVFIGLLFILRGLSLGIPYLSPSVEKMNPQIHMNGDSSSVPEGVAKSCCPEKK